MTVSSDAPEALPSRAVIYLRVSSKSQVDTDYDPEGLSIPAQREICRRKADSLGLSIVGEYVELGRSGTTVQNRPEYQAMMQRIGAQRDVDYVMVYQLSRLNRNRVDDALLMIQMDAVGAKLLSATENIDDTPAGQMTRGILASINQYRSASEGEDIARKMAHKARLGGTIGPARLGYLNVKEDVDGRQVSAIAIEEARAPLIRQGFELYASGDYALARLQRKMADLGLTTRTTRRHPNAREVSKNKWHQMLRDPYYMGLVTYKGELFPGRHEALVPPELFAQVQDVLAERSAPTRRDRTHFHYLKKQLYCERCHRNGRLSKLVYTEARGAGGTYAYFVCMTRKNDRCDLPYLPVPQVERSVARHYPTLHLPADFLGEMRGHIEAALADEQVSLRAVHAATTKKLKDLDKREERLIDLAEEGLPQHKIRARLNKLREDRARLTADQQRTGADLATGAETLTAAMELLRDLPRLYETAVDEVRGLLNDSLFTRLFLDEDGVQDDTLREPFREIAEAAQLRPRPGASRTGAKANSAPANRSAADASLTDLLARSCVTNHTVWSKYVLGKSSACLPGGCD